MIIKAINEYLNTILDIFNNVKGIYNYQASFKEYTAPYIVLNIINDVYDKTPKMRIANIQISLWGKTSDKYNDIYKALIDMEAEFDGYYNYSTDNIDILHIEIESIRTIKDLDSELLQTPFNVKVNYKIN
jgi:hypothetical protein